MPFRSTLSTQSHSASLISVSGLKAMTPAELTRVSRPPKRASQAATAAAAEAGDVTSSSTASRLSLSRPRSASCRAVAIDVPNRDLRAARQQRLRNPQPESARPAGDQRPARVSLNF